MKSNSTATACMPGSTGARSAAGWRELESPARLCRPRRQASRPHPRGKPGFSTLERGCGRETDSLLEGDGFEPSVPLTEAVGFSRGMRRRERSTRRVPGVVFRFQARMQKQAMSADNEAHGYDDEPDPLGTDAETAKRRYIVGVRVCSSTR
jgi:hypothetical protein